MSVINRMLVDLERRGTPLRGRAPGPAGRRPRRRRLRPWLTRAAPGVLAVALVAVAVALWRERAPDVPALIAATGDRAPARAGDGTGAADTTGAADAGPPDAPAVAALRFAAGPRRARLVVELDGPLRTEPGYVRNGSHLALRVPAHAAGVGLPAPPPGQAVFRGLRLDAADAGGAVLGLEVDADARFDLTRSAERIVLTGRLPPEPRAPEPQAGAADGAGAAAATTDSAAAAGASAAAGGAGEGGAAPDRERAAAAGMEPDATSAGDDTASSSRDRGDGDRPADGGGDAAAATSGEVRKSKPERSPAERARRLERTARRLLDEGRAGAARARLQRALAADPARHGARDLLAALALRAGDRGAARELLAEGVARAPERPAYVKPYARLLVDADRTGRALALLERAAPNAPDDAGYRALMAAVAQRLGRHEQAVTEYTRALEIDRGRGLWWLGLAISLVETGHPQQARAAFREARASGDLSDRLDRWARSRIEALRAREE